MKPSTIAIAAALAVGTLTAGASFADNPAKTRIVEQRKVAPFKAIETSGPYHVIVKAQGVAAVDVAGDAKQLADVETVVVGDTLLVRPLKRNTFGFHFSFGKAKESVTITIAAPMLRSFKQSGSGDSEIDLISGEQFSVTNSGPGDLHAAGNVRELTVRASGSGDTDLHQIKASKVRLDMTGPGDVQLAGIDNELTIEASGSGDLRAVAL
jgi:hypothetical protein